MMHAAACRPTVPSLRPLTPSHLAAQVGQLVALEYLVGVALPDKVKQTAVALKALYDEDVVEEVRCSRRSLLRL